VLRRRLEPLGREDGQSLILLVLTLPVLLAVAAFVVDGAKLFVQHQSAQNTADAVALALAQDLPCAGSDCPSDPTFAADNAYYTSSNGLDNPLVPCDSTNTTNCYVTPVGSDYSKIQVKITEASRTFFAGAAFKLFGGGTPDFKASASAIASASSGPPPPFTFVALNKTAACENHTLILRANAQLKVDSSIYVDSCNSPHDAFDIKGTSGSLTANGISVVGGWEKENTTDTLSADNGTDLCNYSNSTLVPSPTPAGCPLTGQPVLQDPLSDTPAPALGVPAWGGFGPPVSVTTMARSAKVATLTTSSAHGLAVGDSVTVSGLGSGFDGVYTVKAVPNATTFTYDNSLGSDGCGATCPDLPTITGYQLSSGVATVTVSPGTTLVSPNPVTVGGLDPFPTGPGAYLVFNGPKTVSAVGSGGTTFSYSRPRPAFTRNISNKQLQGGVATLTTSAVHNLVVGDLVNIVGVDPLLNGGPFTVTSVPSTTKFTYADSAAGSVTVTKKAIANTTTATLTAANNLTAGDHITVSLSPADSRFDGPRTVTAATAGNLSFTIPSVVANVTNTSASAGTATLTTAATPQLETGDTVAVSTGLLSFDGSVAVTGVNVGAKTFSYTPLTFQNSSWTKSGTTVTFTTASAHGLHAGNTIAVTTFGGAQACLNGTFSVAAATSTTFAYTVPAACNPGASGTQKGKFQIVTAASASASGTATLTTLPAPGGAGSNTGGTATVPGFIAATNVNVTNGLSATGNVAPTAASGTLSPAIAPAAGAVAKNLAGSPAIPAPYTVASGTQTLSPGTYYGGICIGAADCTAAKCTPTAYSPAETLSATLTATATSATVSGTGIQNNDVIQIDGEWMKVTAGGGTTHLTVTRGYGGTPASFHSYDDKGDPVTGARIFKVKSTPDATVNLQAGTYIMAGGGFHVCGSAVLNAPNVLIYNTVDPTTSTGAGALAQVILNTTGGVTLGPQTTGCTLDQGGACFPYTGLTVFEANGQELSPGDKCDTKAHVSLYPGNNDWDVALLSMAPTATPGPVSSGALGSVSGTIYAPGASATQHANFTAEVSGTANLAVFSDCIFIGADAQTEFAFQPSGLFGLGFSLTG
jgi:Putative Flp pilus-assembly TadE/G-like